MRPFTLLLAVVGPAAAFPFASVWPSNPSATARELTSAPETSSNPDLSCLHSSNEGCAYTPPFKRDPVYTNATTTTTPTNSTSLWSPLAAPPRPTRDPPVPIGFAPDPSDNTDYDSDLKKFQKRHHEWSIEALRERIPSSYKRIATNYNASAAYRPLLREPMKTYSALDCGKKCSAFGDRCLAFGHFKERAPLCSVGIYNHCEELVVAKVEMCELYGSALRKGDVNLGEFDWNLGGKRITRAVRAFNGYNRYWRRPGNGKMEVDGAGGEGEEVDHTWSGGEGGEDAGAQSGDDEVQVSDTDDDEQVGDDDGVPAAEPKIDCAVYFTETKTETYRQEPITKPPQTYTLPPTTTTQILRADPVTLTNTVVAAPVTVTTDKPLIVWQTTGPTTTQTTTLTLPVQTVSAWSVFTSTEWRTSTVVFPAQTVSVWNTFTSTERETVTLPAQTVSVWNAATSTQWRKETETVKEVRETTVTEREISRTTVTETTTESAIWAAPTGNGYGGDEWRGE